MWKVQQSIYFSRNLKPSVFVEGCKHRVKYAVLWRFRVLIIWRCSAGVWGKKRSGNWYNIGPLKGPIHSQSVDNVRTGCLSINATAFLLLQLQSEPIGPDWPACNSLWAGERPDAPGAGQHPVQHRERPRDSSRVRLTQDPAAARGPLLTGQTSHHS